MTKFSTPALTLLATYTDAQIEAYFQGFQWAIDSTVNSPEIVAQAVAGVKASLAYERALASVTA